MGKSPKSKAESFFAPPSTKEDLARQEKEAAQKEIDDHTAKLKALRLAKEAEEKAGVE